MPVNTQLAAPAPPPGPTEDTAAAHSGITMVRVRPWPDWAATQVELRWLPLYGD
jgi:hypothetical protein